MLKFCRNCGKELILTPANTCAKCGAQPIKAISFCRYCGHPTKTAYTVCPYCGAAIRPIAAKSVILANRDLLLMKLGKIVNLFLVFVLLTLYVIFVLPNGVKKTISAETSELIQSTTGYTAFPLDSLSAYPPRLPPLGNIGEIDLPLGINVSSKHQITVYAKYTNARGVTRLENVTSNCTFKSSDSTVAKVDADGNVYAISPGSATVTAFYTAAPGSANMAAAAAGQEPVTVSVEVPVTVENVPIIAGGYPVE